MESNKKEVKTKAPKKIISTGVITKIQATSRISSKIKETFYTFEFVQEVNFDPTKIYNFEIEKEALWDAVHSEVDKQLTEIISLQKY